MGFLGNQKTHDKSKSQPVDPTTPTIGLVENDRPVFGEFMLNGQTFYTFSSKTNDNSAVILDETEDSNEAITVVKSNNKKSKSKSKSKNGDDMMPLYLGGSAVLLFAFYFGTRR
jgi:hypothetical protein